MLVLLAVNMLLPSATAKLLADVDGDGRVLSVDARLLMRASVGLSPWTDEMFEVGDLDGDRALTAKDADAILRIAVGLGNAADSDETEMDGATLKGLTTKGYKIYEKDGITYIDGILIANKTYALPSDYNPGGLIDVCAQAFAEMSDDAYYNAGLNLFEISGFRSYETQDRIYSNYVATDGKMQADTYSARPGHSEHQSGLALDVNSLEGAFAYTQEAQWIEENCHKYGFILRYPEGKTGQTGYIYEPWHIRYVGVEIATKIYNSGLCLEEYYGITSQYDS